MRLEDGDDAAALGTRRPHDGRDLGRMDRVVVDEARSARLSLALEAAVDAAVRADGGRGLVQREAERASDPEGRRRIQQIVPRRDRETQVQRPTLALDADAGLQAGRRRGQHLDAQLGVVALTVRDDARRAAHQDPAHRGVVHAGDHRLRSAAEGRERALDAILAVVEIEVVRLHVRHDRHRGA